MSYQQFYFGKKIDYDLSNIDRLDVNKWSTTYMIKLIEDQSMDRVKQN